MEVKINATHHDRQSTDSCDEALCVIMCGVYELWT